MPDGFMHGDTETLQHQGKAIFDRGGLIDDTGRHVTGVVTDTLGISSGQWSDRLGDVDLQRQHATNKVVEYIQTQSDAVIRTGNLYFDTDSQADTSAGVQYRI